MTNPYSPARGSLVRETRKHHWMIAATLTVATQEGDDGEVSMSSVNMNGIVVTENDYITALDLGQGNQLLQQMFIKRFNPDMQKTEIVDIFTISVCHLGLMKNSVFNNLPKSVSTPEEDAPEIGTTDLDAPQA